MSTSNALSSVSTLSVEQLLQGALTKWNEQPGELWNVRAKWNGAGWLEQKSLEAEIFRGPPRLLLQPGPYKRSGAFVVLNQYAPCFQLDDPKSGRPLTGDACAVWVPRVTLWLLPIFAAARGLDGKALAVTVACPTPHFQADLLCYLRSLYRVLDRNPAFKSEYGILTERVMTTALIVEAAAYASMNGIEGVKRFVTSAGECFGRSEGAAKEEILIDVMFNSPEFLTNAMGVGLD